MTMTVITILCVHPGAGMKLEASEVESPRTEPFACEIAQALMERVLASVDHSYRFQQQDGSYMDACHWPGVRCKSDGSVYKISWDADRFRLPRGRLQLEYLPPTAKKFNIRGQGIHTHLSVRFLPRESRRVDVSKNDLHGSLEISALPVHIHVFEAQFNKLSGPIELVRLPRALHILNLYGNHIEQEAVYCDKFPPAVESIDLRFNSVHKLRSAETGHKILVDEVSVVKIDGKRGSRRY